MRKIILYCALIGLILIGFSSCSKTVVPSGVAGKKDKNYDQAAFNFVYVEAIKQKLMGNGGEALKYLEQCIDINPASDAVYYQMAQILAAGGDISNAKKYTLKALKIDDRNLWYLMMMAGMYYQEKNIDSSIIYYEKAVYYFPGNDKLQLTLGNLYSENKNYDKAISIFGSLDNKYGVNEESTVSAIRNLMSAGMYDEAFDKTNLLLAENPDELLYNGLLAEIYKGKGEMENALGVYSKLMEQNPEDADTQLSLCDFLITEKSYDDLFSFLNVVILNNKVQREDKIALVAQIIELPDLNTEQQDKLLMALMILEANYKDDDIVPMLRPELLIRQGRLPEAAARLEEITKNNKGNYYAWEKLLFVYLQMRDFEELTAKGEQCASIFNRSFLAKILFATGATETNKFQVALEELRKAEILAGDNKEFLVQVNTLKADVYYRMKDYNKAFEIFEQIIKDNSDDITVLNNYAYYLAEQNMKLKEAEEMAEKVIETEKNNNTYLDTYAWVLYKRGKLKEAARIMEQIITSGEEPDAEWYDHFGYILKKQKKCDEAIKNWSVALKLDSSKTYLNNEIEDCKK